MRKQTEIFNFLATGIGSVPFQDIDATCQDILYNFSHIPFWPQFVQMNHFEDMMVQFTEGLPFLAFDKDKKAPVLQPSSSRESELTIFYDHFLSHDLDYFSISRNYASGLHALLEQCNREKTPAGSFIKGQTVGPITLTAGISDQNGKAVLHDPELLEAITNGLAIKALWQVKELVKTGRKPILFIDEPFLSGFGSAFTPIQREEVINTLKKFIDYLKKHIDVLIGIHCCGNTDWSMIVDSGPDIINFDAFEYMDYFFLYSEDIIRFYRKGGVIAWGIVPTSGFSENEKADHLYLKLKDGLSCLKKWGINEKLLSERSILTPACGMGSLAPDKAKTGFNILADLSELCHNRNC